MDCLRPSSRFKGVHVSEAPGSVLPACQNILLSLDPWPPLSVYEHVLCIPSSSPMVGYSVSTDDLRDLFSMRTDTLSDTFESLNLDPKVPLCAVQVAASFDISVLSSLHTLCCRHPHFL